MGELEKTFGRKYVAVHVHFLFLGGMYEILMAWNTMMRLKMGCKHDSMLRKAFFFFFFFFSWICDIRRFLLQNTHLCLGSTKKQKFLHSGELQNLDSPLLIMIITHNRINNMGTLSFFLKFIWEDISFKKF